MATFPLLIWRTIMLYAIGKKVNGINKYLHRSHNGLYRLYDGSYGCVLFNSAESAQKFLHVNYRMFGMKDEKELSVLCIGENERS